ncbi:MAG: hypothetical protein ACREH4_12505, partial [Vitreimonas sp.]
MTSTADTVSRLWTAARALFARLRAAIGETASLAALNAEDVRDLRLWLRTLEAMVRRIVLIEAIALVRRGDAADGRTGARHEAGPPAVTLIALPQPSVRVQSQCAATADAPRARRARSLRLWPRSPASA